MKRNTRWQIAMLVVLCLNGGSYAQERQEARRPDDATASPDQSREQEASPPPGEDVLRPTEHAVRLTPRMARALGRAWIEYCSADRYRQAGARSQRAAGGARQQRGPAEIPSRAAR